MRPEPELQVPILLIFAVAAVVLATPADASVVTVHGTRWQAMQPGPEGASPSPPPIHIADRVVALTPDAATDGSPGVAIEATWTVSDGAPAWVDLRLVDRGVLVTDVRIDGVPAPTWPAADGTHLVAWLEPGSRIALRGVRPGDPLRSSMSWALLPAASGISTFEETGDRVPAWTGGVVVDHALWGGGGRIGSQLVPPKASTPDGLLVSAEIGLGVTITEDLMHVRGRVRHLVRRGVLEQVVFVVPRAGRDLKVTGPNVGRFESRGNTVVAILRTPTNTLSTLELSYSLDVPAGEGASLPLPRIDALDVTGARTTLQVARSGDIEVLPELTGWSTTASTELPAWGRGLVDGAPTASFLGTERSSGSLSLLRYVPVQGPEVLVDVAEILLATSRDGRVLLRARYEVTNERAAVLRVHLPDASRLLALRVGDSPVATTFDSDGALRIPLRRSIESLGGLLSFPVEFAILVEDDPWARRELRTVPLPQVEAPIAILRTTAHLPPGHLPWRTRQLSGYVQDFTRGAGITYGIQVRSEADRDRVAQADAIFGEAVRAWETNSFEEAQGLLDELGALGAGNENVAKLQGNLSLLLEDEEEDGEADTDAPASTQSVVLARRVKDQAKAKAGAEERAWEEAQREAERSYRAGDYARAEQEAEKALEIGKKLERYEQKESAEVSTRNAKVGRVLEEARKGRSRRRASTSAAGPAFGGFAKKAPAAVESSLEPASEAPPPPEPSPDALNVDGRFDMDADDVTGTFAFDPAPVFATTRSVPVPELGSVLRFQRLLLPSGAAPTVTLGARAARPSEESR